LQEVRQAIVHAINNEGIVKKIMKGTATPAGQQSPKGYAGYNPNCTPPLRPEKGQGPDAPKPASPRVLHAP
jgi:peptide/nickel transport system substrate-binding protein